MAVHVNLRSSSRRALVGAAGAVPNTWVEKVLEYRAGVELTIRFDPPDELAQNGYRPERARIVLSPYTEVPEAFPLGPRRTWRHRNPRPGDTDPVHATGALCLWYPKDPRPLRWEPEDGFEAYFVFSARHLFSEEFFRREGYWPSEETPHGHPGGTGRWTVKSEELRNIVERHKEPVA